MRSRQNPRQTHRENCLRSLYVCYLGLDDPLVYTQVVAYLAGLAQCGHVVHLLSFEKARLDAARRRALRGELSVLGISWHGLQYHKRPSLPATVFDVLCGSLLSAYLMRRHRLTALHARSHVPAAMALLARRLAHFRLIFDIRGLMAEEFEDAGRWTRGSAPFRLTKWVERLGIDRAAAIVVLTERVRDHLFGGGGDSRVAVIPCCADIAGIEGQRGRREAIRRQLGLGDRPVLIYVGKFTGWYLGREMAEFFVAAREAIPGLHFLILTQMDPQPIEHELARLGVRDGDCTITQAEPAAVGGYLAAADAAISLIRASFSKISSSPTKIGEYLAAGLPLVSTSGVGDIDALLDEFEIGVRVETFDPAALTRASTRLATLLADPDHAARSRSAARARLSLTDVGIPAYDAIYSRLAAAPWLRTP